VTQKLKCYCQTRLLGNISEKARGWNKVEKGKEVSMKDSMEEKISTLKRRSMKSIPSYRLKFVSAHLLHLSKPHLPPVTQLLTVVLSGSTQTFFYFIRKLLTNKRSSNKPSKAKKTRNSNSSGKTEEVIKMHSGL